MKIAEKFFKNEESDLLYILYGKKLFKRGS